ncbi:hypothetical protein D3C76_1315080 [compost metagenome]
MRLSIVLFCMSGSSTPYDSTICFIIASRWVAAWTSPSVITCVRFARRFCSMSTARMADSANRMSMQTPRSLICWSRCQSASSKPW